MLQLTYSVGRAGSDYYAFGSATALELNDVAKNPDVIQVAPDVPLNYNDSRLDSTGLGSTTSATTLQTDMFRIRSILGADKVNSLLNVTGKGVNVAVVDTG